MVGARHTSGRALIMALLLAGTLASGCGQKTIEGVPETQKGLQQLMGVATRYRARNGQLPPNEAAFKKFINDLKPSEREELGIHDVDKLFISPRDNQPFVIRYGVKDTMMPSPADMKRGKPGSGAPAGPPVFAYEKTSSGGKRWCIYTMGGSAMEIDDETLKKYVPDLQ